MLTSSTSIPRSTDDPEFGNYFFGTHLKTLGLQVPYCNLSNTDCLAFQHGNNFELHRKKLGVLIQHIVGLFSSSKAKTSSRYLTDITILLGGSMTELVSTAVIYPKSSSFKIWQLQKLV
jgi:hypothetical protein